jgi:hypothetical protein
VVLTDFAMDEQLRINDITHARGIKCIIAQASGLFGYVVMCACARHPDPQCSRESVCVRRKIFVDCGGAHQVNDTNGEQPHTCMVAAVTQVGAGRGRLVWSGNGVLAVIPGLKCRGSLYCVPVIFHSSWGSKPAALC